MHRSGTSLCSHVLSALGYDMADEALANSGNAKGHWERLELVAFHDRILALFDRGWFGPNHGHELPEAWWIDPRVREIRGEIIAWLHARRGETSYFGFKDPRAALLVPLWDEICREMGLRPRFVCCVRHPAAVALSLEARARVAHVNDPPFREGLYRWLVYNARLVMALSRRPVCILPYDGWFEPGSQNLLRLARYLGLEEVLNSDAVRGAIASIVDPSLRHQTPLVPDGSVLGRMYEELVSCADIGAIGGEVAGMARLLSEYSGLTHHIQQRAERVAGLENGLAAAAAQAAEQDAAVAAMQAELDRRQAEIAALHDNAAMQAAERGAAVAAMQAELDHRQAEIAALHDNAATQAAERGAAVAAMQAELDHRQAEIAALHDNAAMQAAERGAAVAAMQAELDHRQAEIAALHDNAAMQAAERGAAVAAMQAELDRRQAEIAALHDNAAMQAAERGAAVAAMQAELDRRQAEIAALHDNAAMQAAERGAAVAAMQAELDRHQAGQN